MILKPKTGAGKIVGIVRSSGGRFELVENVQDLIFVDLNFLPDFDYKGGCGGCGSVERSG